MREEDVNLQNLYLREQATKEKLRMEEEAQEMREKEIEEKWRKFMLNSEMDKQQTI